MSFQINTETGLCKQADFIESPNFDSRPGNEQPQLIVVHGISLPPNQFGGQGITQLFTNQLDPNEDPYFETIKDLRVSAHALIRRDGALLQFVPFHERAWHAGVSEFKGRSRCNDFSIGIELEGTDDTCYTSIQYDVLSELIQGLWQAYPSLHERQVVGHCDIAPGRKTDPGEFFQWQSLNRMLENSG